MKRHLFTGIFIGFPLGFIACLYLFIPIFKKSEVTERFDQLHNILDNQAEQNSQKNRVFIGYLDSLRQSGKVADSTVQHLTELRSRTEDITSLIKNIIKELDKEPASLDPKSSTKVNQLMIAGEGDTKGKAYSLQTSINEHVGWINISFNKSYPLLALDGKDDPLYVNQETGEEKIPGAKEQDFAHLNFENTPTIAALAFLTEKKVRITQMEKEIMDEIQEDLGLIYFKPGN